MRRRRKSKVEVVGEEEEAEEDEEELEDTKVFVADVETFQLNPEDFGPA